MSAPLAHADRPATERTFFKWGAWARVLRRMDDAEGRRWHRDTKIIAAALMEFAYSNRGYVCYLSTDERERFRTVARAIQSYLDMDEKTFKKRLQPLIDGGLVSVDRNRAGASTQFCVARLFEFFGEERPAVPKVTSLQNRNASGSTQNGNDSGSAGAGSEPDVFPRRPEDFPVRTGPSTQSEPDDIPVSTDPHVSSPDSSSPRPLDVAAARLGLKTTSGMADEIRAVSCILDAWGLSLKKQRALVKQYGIVSVADAAGYVEEQMRLYPRTVQTPSGLFTHALKEGKSGTLVALAAAQNGKPSGSTPSEGPGDAQTRKPSGSDVTDRRNGNASGSAVERLFEAIQATVRTRVARPDYDVIVKGAHAVLFDGSQLVIGFPSTWLRGLAEERLREHYARAAQELTGQQQVKVVFVAADER